MGPLLLIIVQIMNLPSFYNERISRISLKEYADCLFFSYYRIDIWCLSIITNNFIFRRLAIVLSLPDMFSPDQIRDIISDNLELNRDKGIDTAYSHDMVTKIFDKIASCNSVLETRARIIKRASYMLGLITNWHPFSNFNRHSAYASSVKFLRMNSLDLPLYTVDEEKELFKLMDKTKDKENDDSTICSEIETFLTTKVIDRPVYRYY